MGRRKKTSSRSLSETESRSVKILPEGSIDVIEDLSVLTAEQARYLLSHAHVLSEIFQDNTPGYRIVLVY